MMVGLSAISTGRGVESSKRRGFGVVARDKECSFVAGMAGSSDWVASPLLAELLAARREPRVSARKLPCRR